MAPFKLKFRMGSSRSTSQEVDSDPQVNQSLLGNNNNNNYCSNSLDIGASNSTINSIDCNNLISSIDNNDKKLLLPNTTFEKLGYTNPIVTHNTDSISVDGNSSLNFSYEHILEDNHLRNLDSGSRLTISTEIASSSDSDEINGELVNIEQHKPIIINTTKTTSTNNASKNQKISTFNISSDDLRLSTSNNIILSKSIVNKKSSNTKTLTQSTDSNSVDFLSNNITTLTGIEINKTINTTVAPPNTINNQNQILFDNNIDGNRKESIDSTEYLISTMTATPPSSQENLLLNSSNDDECISGSCEPLFRSTLSSTASSSSPSAKEKLQEHNQKQECLQQPQQQQLCEPQQQQQYCEEQQHYDEIDDNLIQGSSIIHGNDDEIDGNLCGDHSHTYCTGENDQDCPSYIAERNEIENSQRENFINSSNSGINCAQNNYYGDEDDDDNWNSNQNEQIQQEQLQHFISNKSSKKIYKAVAKQWGITCKMSDQCRCMDCQSKYFDCEYDQNEHHKTDGGLGAGTPMFINEVMQGSACTIL